MAVRQLVPKTAVPSLRASSRRSNIGQSIDYASAVLSCPSGIVITDPSKTDNPIVFVNPAFTELTGYSSAEAIGRNCRFLQGPLSDPKATSEIREAIAQGHSVRTEVLNYRKDGAQFWTDLAINPTRDASGDLVGFVGVLSDLTERKQAEATAHEATTQLDGIIQNIPGFIFRRVWNPDGSVTYPYMSSYFASLIGHSEVNSATAADLWKHVHPDDVGIARQAIERSAADLSSLVLEYRMISESGEERWIRNSSSPRLQKNGDVVWDGVGIDITTEKLAETRLTYLAYHDPLTGLRNRTFLTEQLVLAIEAARKEGAQISLSHLLIVGFSEINETLGINEGDAALKSVAARLSELTALDRNAISARLAGAEFAVLRRGKTAAIYADEFAGIMMRSLAQPIPVGQVALMTEPCIGTALLAPGELGELSADAAAAELMKRAAIALSAANKAGAGTHRRYDQDLDHRRQHRMMIRHSMREAIDNDQFELHYQPLVDLQSSTIVSAEALIRWQHPQLGLLRPDLFIALAEESGLIGPLGDWVMRTAMRQMIAWESEGLDPPSIALNISSVQVKLPDFIETVRRALAETGADARRFDLELTEGILLELSPAILAVLSELKQLGFKLVIDDFGAGHSSLQYLRNFPIDKLKIDRIFVRQLVADSSDALIIRAITSLARSLKIGLVAEGIETIEQRDFLNDQGCTTGQGYYFSLPLAAEDFAWMIKQKTVLPIVSAKKATTIVNKTLRPK
jgi:PAS domain S-box-containing protein/diguanylate cyclase (GGDEF)-like protein